MLQRRSHWKRRLLICFILAAALVAISARFVAAWVDGEQLPGSGVVLLAIVMLLSLGFLGLVLVAVAVSLRVITAKTVRRLEGEFPGAVIVPVTMGADQARQMHALGASDPLLARTPGMVAVIDSKSVSIWRKGSTPRMLAHFEAQRVQYRVGEYGFYARRYRTLCATFVGGPAHGSLDLLVLDYDRLIPRMASSEQLERLMAEVHAG